MDNVSKVVADKMCCGCGACYSICPKKGCIEFVEGKYVNYPRVNDEKCIECKLCLKVCPGNINSNRLINRDKVEISSKIKQIKVSYSTDNVIRMASASGGIITQILKDMFENGKIDSAVVVTQDSDDVLKNRVKIITNVEELRSSQGSRYSPASNCISIKDIIKNDNYSKVAFVGKPCDIEALKAFENINAKLARKIVIRISIMCHHAPTRKGLINLLEAKKVNIKNIKTIKFRGNGWPGEFQVLDKDGVEIKTSYFDAWNNYLSQDENSKCTYCDNPFPLEADFIIGDPWGDEYKSDTEGKSLVIVRSEEASQVINFLEENNKVISKSVTYKDVERYQKNLLIRYNDFEINSMLFRAVRGYKVSKSEYIKLYKNDPKNILRYIKRRIKYKKLYKEWKYE